MSFLLFILFHTVSCQMHNRSRKSVPQDHGRGAVHHSCVELQAATISIQTYQRRVLLLWPVLLFPMKKVGKGQTGTRHFVGRPLTCKANSMFCFSPVTNNNITAVNLKRMTLHLKRMTLHLKCLTLHLKLIY